MYMHPKAYFFLQDQDRERLLHQKALERAAESGGEQVPGQARGGIVSFARKARHAASSRVFGRPSTANPTSPLSGPSGA